VALRFRLRTTPGASTFYCPLRLSGASTFGVVYLCNFAGYTSLSILLGASYASVACVGVALTLDTLTHSLVVTYNGGGASTPGNYTVDYDGVAQTVATSSTTNRTSGQSSYLGTDITTAVTLQAPVDLGDVVYDNTRTWSATERTNLSSYLGGQ
jgi:hypothetical protein